MSLLPEDVIGLMKKQLRVDNLYNVLNLPNPFPSIAMTNLLVNGNFSSAWSTSNATMTVANNEGTLVASASGGQANSPFNVVIGNKYYYKILVKTDSPQVGIYVPGTELIYHPGNGNYENITAIVEPTTETAFLRVRDFRTEGFTPIYLKWALVVDLTSCFGAGNEPTIEQMDLMLSQLTNSWFGGTRNVGKNYETIGKTFVNINGKMQLVDFSSTQPLTGKTIVCFGDSITENGNYPEYVASRTGANVINVGFGGCRMARHPYAEYDAFSMYRLSDSIASGDWSLQDQAVIDLLANYSDDNSEPLNRLKAIDFNEVDIITIFYGTNDFRGNIPLGIEADLDGTTIYGAINKTVDNILTKYPHLQIAFITPMFRERQSSSDTLDSDNHPNGDGVYLIEYGDTIKQASEKYHLPVLDMYRTSGINKYTAPTYLIDGLHPNNKGFEYLGNKIGAFLLSTY